MNAIRHFADDKMDTSNKKRLCKYPHFRHIVKRASAVTTVFLWVPFLSVLSICLISCGNKFLDPTDIGRYRPIPAVNVILDSLSVAEEAPSAWANAEDPKPIDAMVFETDYAFGPGDIVRITIFELLQEGALFANDYIVTETGKLDIPEVGEIETAGFTESQLKEEIKQILSPSILKDPSVTVTLMNSQQRMFSILGDGIPGSGRYIIPRSGFKLADALAVAGGISQFNISYIYVSRSFTGKEPIAEPTNQSIIEPGEPGQTKHFFEFEQQMPKTITPSANLQETTQKQELLMTAAEMITDKELTDVASPEGSRAIANRIQRDAYAKEETPDSLNRLAGRETPINEDEDEVGRIEWTFRDGVWVPVQTGRPSPTKPVIKVEPEKPHGTLEEKIPTDFGWDQIGTAGVQTRVIKIPADRLYAGDPRYNIVIRAGDTIYVPVDIIGEFSITGNVNGQGYINITGRPMTLKMAIAAAGGLGPLAWPKRCEVIRRIGKKKEVIVMVDLDKIASGEQPDFFIKPNDLIRVGTHPTARWRAVLRNAFRATYGFGFIYDRNFADRDLGTSRPIPDWF
ncbi:MAG: polysaccharide biosynthesis/export family protein [Planctomycetota bacterium]|jgi:polysaccharide export outer membrane protein